MQYIWLGVFLTIIFTGTESCKTDPEVPNPKEEPEEIAPDLIAEHLILNQATLITGSLPNAQDGGIKMEIKDTIFSVKGFALGSRIQFQKAAHQDITGFYIYVIGASFYFDVPEEIVDGQLVFSGDEDTSTVLQIDLDLEPLGDEVEYPFSTEILIQPHDASGTPVDEFKRFITIEDPEDQTGNGCNTIAQPVSNNRIHWEWEFTIREYNGEILNVFGPGLATRINSQGAGCCDSQGRSWTTSSHPSCGPGTTSMTWVQLEVEDYSVRPYELWQIYNDGTVFVFSNYIKKQYDRSITNFCDGIVGYTFENEDIDGSGTHDFTPGGSFITFNWTQWNGGFRASSGQVVYTCHTMIRSWGVDDKFSAVYRRVIYNPYPTHNPIEFYYQWKPWFD